MVVAGQTSKLNFRRLLLRVSPDALLRSLLYDLQPTRPLTTHLSHPLPILSRIGNTQPDRALSLSPFPSLSSRLALLPFS